MQIMTCVKKQRGDKIEKVPLPAYQQIGQRTTSCSEEDGKEGDVIHPRQDGQFPCDSNQTTKTDSLPGFCWDDTYFHVFVFYRIFFVGGSEEEQRQTGEITERKEESRIPRMSVDGSQEGKGISRADEPRFTASLDIGSRFQICFFRCVCRTCVSPALGRGRWDERSPRSDSVPASKPEAERFLFAPRERRPNKEKPSWRLCSHRLPTRGVKLLQAPTCVGRFNQYRAERRARRTSVPWALAVLQDS